ncbi:MAG TPA: WGR domain-containing protein [Sulfuricurvum sp.]|nr:WGR domain-containing protein [Sulfuricurvum sp.]HQT37269.1 WGR domain-containing protein [Sulfuricurvum sp.]
MKLLLKRTVNSKERYYALELIANLFDEYLVIRTYGSCTNTKPTGVISNTYKTLNTAQEAMEKVLHEKQKRGYMSPNQ